MDELEVKGNKKNLAIGVRLLQLCYGKRTLKQRQKVYQGLVLILTFFAYTSYHMCKRPISAVKSTLNPNCTITSVNNSCTAWQPFDNPDESKELFGALDAAFLFTYAFAMFISGYIAEHVSVRHYLFIGMFGTGICTALFGTAYYYKIHSLAFFFFIQALTGIFQATGWPCVVVSVANWFGEGRRGLIMGIWNCHVSIGNIAGSAIAGIWAGDEWGLSFIVPGIIIAFFSIIIFLFLVPEPSLVGMGDASTSKLIESNYGRINPEIEDKLLRRGQSVVSMIDSTTVEPKQKMKAIGFFQALLIPGVLEYAFCLFFAKCVSYTFLYWLPFYVRNTEIDGKFMSTGQAADLATLFDVGGMIGGILAGYISDKSKCSGITTVVFLLLAAPSLFLYNFYGHQSLALNIFYMMISGVFVNGPYALITTAVSASLGTHQSLLGSTKAMATVSAIIDGTGSLGAACGPLIAGLVSAGDNWNNVFFLLIGADIAAAVLLLRQVYHELKLCRTMSKAAARPRQNTSVIVNENSEQKPLLGQHNSDLNYD